MAQNLFYPIYQQLEKELVELSYYITFDKKQLTIYSTKIADMILRTVSEIENISKELCKKENIKFYDSKKHIRKIVYFNDYFQELDKVYGLSYRLIDFTLQNCNDNIFDSKLIPFRKDKIIKVGQKERATWAWYDAYNKIKHDRVKNFRQADLNNLIYSLSALFILNVYYMDKVFYDKNEYNHNRIIEQIEGFSEVFCIDYTVDTSGMESSDVFNEYTFFNPVSFFDIAKKYATYIIYQDIEIKTSGDEAADFMDKIESNVMTYNKENQTLRKSHNDYKIQDHYTKCKLVAKLNRNN